jgi:PAS domain S-box-containing protein
MLHVTPWLPAVSLAGGILVLDLFTPIGVATGALHALVIPIAARRLDRRGVLGITLLCGAFTLLGAGLSPPGGVAWMSIVNRGLSLVLIGGAAGLTLARMRVEEDLRREQRSLVDFKQALDQSAIVAATDARGRITYANDRFCQISQYDRGELLGQDHRLINSGHHPREFMAELWSTIRSGRVWRGEICNRARDRSLYWVDTTIVPFVDERGQPYQYLAIRADITERKRAEQRLVEQGALVRLGQMAAVVAHEVKNPLAGIGGAIQIIGGRLPEGSPDRQIVREILARIAALDASVKDLLLFARPRLPQRVSLPLRAMLEETVALLRRDPQAQGVTVRLPERDVVVAGDAEQLRPVLLNVLLNAAQAMQGQGEVRLDLEARGGEGVLVVADQGPGIAPEVLDKVFEPFFTTRSRGTGLGLAIARRVLEMHGGSIDIRCPATGGTLVEIRLPLATVPQVAAGD